MIDKKKVIKGLEICSEHGSWHGIDCRYNEAYKDCPYRGCETGCVVTIAKDALALLKEQEPQSVIVKCEPSNGNILWFANCPKCGQGIERDKHKNYCGYCGQAVKWE